MSLYFHTAIIITACIERYQSLELFGWPKIEPRMHQGSSDGNREYCSAIYR